MHYLTCARVYGQWTPLTIQAPIVIGSENICLTICCWYKSSTKQIEMTEITIFQLTNIFCQPLTYNPIWQTRFPSAYLYIFYMIFHVKISDFCMFHSSCVCIYSWWWNVLQRFITRVTGIVDAAHLEGIRQYDSCNTGEFDRHAQHQQPCLASRTPRVVVR